MRISRYASQVAGSIQSGITGGLIVLFTLVSFTLLCVLSGLEMGVSTVETGFSGVETGGLFGRGCRRFWYTSANRSTNFWHHISLSLSHRSRSIASRDAILSSISVRRSGLNRSFAARNSMSSGFLQPIMWFSVLETCSKSLNQVAYPSLPKWFSRIVTVLPSLASASCGK